MPRVFYGLTRGNQTYRFTANATVTQAVTGAVGTAFELYSNNESDNNYIPAVAVKVDDSTIEIVIQGDYTVDSSSFNAVNMTTGASETITLSGVLSLQQASSLSDYTAADNKEKQITVINNLETNSKNVIFASLDLNSDGVYNWVEIGNFVDGTDGKSVLSITSSTYSTIISLVKVGDTLLAGEEFTADGNSFDIGDLFLVSAISPLTLTSQGNIRGEAGLGISGVTLTGENGLDFTMSDGTHMYTASVQGPQGYTPYIQDNYWYINGINTNVKALGTDGTNGTNGQSFQMQSGLYSVPANWGENNNTDGEGNPLLQLPTLPTTGITGKGYVVYDPLTTPLAPFYDLYFANDNDVSWTIIHPFSGIAGQDGTDGYTPYIQNNNWYINGVNTGVAATGPQGPAGPGVPSGGTAGQVLSKVDGTDYNTAWTTPSAGGGKYAHFIHIQNSNGNFWISFTIMTEDSSKYTSLSSLTSAISSTYGNNKYIAATGALYTSGNKLFISDIYLSSSNLYIYGHMPVNATETITIDGVQHTVATGTITLSPNTANISSLGQLFFVSTVIPL